MHEAPTWVILRDIAHAPVPTSVPIRSQIAHDAFRYPDLYPFPLFGSPVLLEARIPQSESIPAGGELPVLRLVGLAVSVSDARVDGHRLFHCHQDRRSEGSAGSQVSAHAVAGDQFLDTGILQVLQFFCGFAGARAGGSGNQSFASGFADYSSARHFVLHISGSGVHRGRVLREATCVAVVSGLRIVHQLISAPDRGSHPAAGAPASASPETEALGFGQSFRWFAAHSGGIVSQVRDRG